MEQAIELIKILVAPVLIVFIVVLFRVPLSDLIDRAKDLRIEGPQGIKIVLSVREAKELAEAMLKEVEIILEDITSEQIGELLNIADGKLTDVSQSFVRGTPYHSNVLRNLRRRHLIRPSEGGQWQPGKHIEITPFGRLVVRLKREQFESVLGQANRP